MLYDTIIIGAGPAGLTASIYASRYKLSNLVIGKVPGGTITNAHKVENFPGVPGVSGAELGQKMLEQAKALGAEILVENVGEIGEVMGNGATFKVKTESGEEFTAKTLIAALGTERKKLNIPGEKEYLGKGVSYCVTCDAPFFKGKTVVLVGGSNAACSGAIHLAGFAEKIYLIYRRNELRAEPVWVEEVKKNPKIEVIYETNLTEILGNGVKVTGVKLDVPYNRFAKTPQFISSDEGKARFQASPKANSKAVESLPEKTLGFQPREAYNGNSTLPADGVFVEIGGLPSSGLFLPLGVELDENSYVKVDEKMKTNIPGLFAAGDLTTKSLILQQVVTACAAGAIAADSVFEYLKRNKS